MNKNTHRKFNQAQKARAAARKVNGPAVGENGIVSINQRRNSAMQIVRNQNPDGRSATATVHVPLLPGRPMQSANHKYMREVEPVTETETVPNNAPNNAAPETPPAPRGWTEV